MRVLHLVFFLSLYALALHVMVGCGADSGGSSASDNSGDKVDTSVGNEDDTAEQSITRLSASDLPKCDSKREAQLAFAINEDQFFVCKDSNWVEIDVKGEDGITTVQEVEATNKKNQWVDPVTGLTWLIGGSGTYAQAVAACTGSYRLPTWAEAIDGITHGVRGIAASIPQGQDFWINISGQYWYATVTAGQSNKFQVLATAAYNIYCVK